MKRSEMHNKILTYIWHTEHLDIPCSLGSDFNQAAEDILSLIEEAGMKPPRYTKLSESNETEAVEGWEDET